MDFDPEDSKELLIQNQLSSERHSHHSRKMISAEAMNEFFHSLLIKENLENESIELQHYYKRNPFHESYNPELLNILINFFDSNSEYGSEGVDAAARIIDTLLIYEYHNGLNPVLDSFLSNDFYQMIFPFFQSSPYVILVFQFAILLEGKALIPTAYNA